MRMVGLGNLSIESWYIGLDQEHMENLSSFANGVNDYV